MTMAGLMLCMMRRISLTHLLGAALLAWIAACGEAESMYPRTLGAPCQAAADCNSGMLCTAQLYPESHYLHACYQECGQNQECPQGSHCVINYFQVDPNSAAAKNVCARTCLNTKFCEALHPDTNSCQAWNGEPKEQQDPNSPKYCGIEN